MHAPSAAAKLAPPPPPDRFARSFEPQASGRPARGPELKVAEYGRKSTGKSALASEKKRALLIHTFLHHELQAAELMAWAILAFPRAPEALRRGLVKILLDEVRHMNLYRGLLAERGVAFGDHEVRDWFWERIPQVDSIAGFLATLGLGFEGANLDRATLFARRFRDAGDEAAAQVQERVAREEVPHVRFAVTWFRELSPQLAGGATLFDAFEASLPSPLSPWVMKGKPIDRALRKRAGLDDDFVDALERWTPSP